VGLVLPGIKVLGTVWPSPCPTESESSAQHLDRYSDTELFNI
jgi:hypothetical protein